MMLDKSKVRNAFTLIEMVVVIALLGIVMAIATAMIIGLMQFSSSEVRLGNRNMEVAALANLFRSDVRVASSALITSSKENKAKGLKLALLSGGEISYEVENGVFVRISPQGKQRLVRVVDVENMSFLVQDNGSMVELYYEEKSDLAKSKGRTFSFRAALNRGQK
jgi:prepilin-type N-terminal cleavage/methylation domain-containing protein